jgi:chemotaxis protein histidine kinase CheA
MSTFGIIQQKLEQFIKKYYSNQLIKGAILFFAIGLFYFLVTLLVEHFLWLNQTGRTILFWMFVAVEIGLFIQFIAFPLTKLFKLQNGLSHEEASKIIGNHFPQVNDKLLNVIQLNQNQRESELLLASIEQKAMALQPIQFKSAINFSKNLKYLKFAAIPVVIFILFSILGEKDIFSSSYERVVNYDTAYEPPAPFSFQIMNTSLEAIENRSFTLNIRTIGEIIPENAIISYNNETYYLQGTGPGIFSHVFSQPVEPIEFTVKANGVSSIQYTLDVIKTPSLLMFEMRLDYPNYTGKKDEELKSTGNASVPEGTRVTWNVTTKNTNEVRLKTIDTSYNFEGKNEKFTFKKAVYRKFDYAITTSNSQLIDYENLSFTLGVIKDEYPEIDVRSKRDSVNSQLTYFLGRVSDDYGLTSLRLVYYPEGNESDKKVEQLSLGKTNFEQFVYTFPGNLSLVDGTTYEYYFEIFDNDALHQFKSSKSGIYSFRKLTKSEEENELLQSQKNSIEGLTKSLERFKEGDKELEELAKTQKEKNNLNWNDKKKLENFIKQKKQQEEIMKNFSKELKDDLENFQPENEENDVFKEQLKERLKENEEQLKENERLLDELEKLQEKIQKEDLTEKLERLAKQNKNSEKNLEQLLELTKRYYVAKKAEKLAEEIQKLGEKQEKLAEEPEDLNTKEKQEEINKEFDAYKKEMENLKKENEALKKPMDIPQDTIGEKQVDKEQQEATDKLEQENKSGASENQKKAGKKMKQMGAQMQMQMMSGQMETIEEDVEMLRQILDNLVVFSFEQEDLMESFKRTEYGSPLFGKKLNVQNDLKLNFQHIDDSLFSLSLRQPMLSNSINKSITDVQFNIDRSLERLAENQTRQGIASQQYTVTGANVLAILLSDLLNNMQNQMQMAGSGSGEGKGKGQGQGQGDGFQLSDIIKKQESLNGKMKEGMDKKGEGNDGEGEGDGKGESGEKEGRDGKGKGENGSDGDGENEGLNGELYQIYKEQMMLRQQLEDKLSKEGLDGNGGSLLRKMKNVEQQLLDKGFNNRTLEQMLNLKYELLKLDKAEFEQGREKRRESKTNKIDYQNRLRLSPESIKKYFNSIEILNREALPLRQEYKEKVHSYFKNIDD